ncbi:MAG TPA: PLP-dependent aspartate aminotransferase family protein [Bacteroidales bacterium]|nr:PLP-dependent aspartate aminotransferase family protein [Bacteroidales bacterium]
MKDQTRIIHSIPTDPLTGAVSVPIYQTSTFVQEAPGVHKGFDYSRTNNPTRRVLEKLIATLEGGACGYAFASGLAAIDAVVKTLKAGDQIVAIDDIYGGAFRLFSMVYVNFGINIRYVNMQDLDKVEEAVSESTKLVWIESPTNPTLKISDIEAIASIAHKKGALLCVDNTFATPASQNPIKLGADIVIHSATKYLGGHSDLVAGLVVTSTEELGEKIKFIQNASGGILAPFDSWLVIRGIETLELRVKQHAVNAEAVASYLASHPKIAAVYYPGLTSHVNHDVAKKQQHYYGGMVSFALKNDTIEAATKLVTSTSLFKLAESLGGVKSLCCHPATMTHKSIPAEMRYQSGISDSLIRLSVGLEDAGDLIDDLEQALLAL